MGLDAVIANTRCELEQKQRGAAAQRSRELFRDNARGPSAQPGPINARTAWFRLTKNAEKKHWQFSGMDFYN